VALGVSDGVTAGVFCAKAAPAKARKRKALRIFNMKPPITELD
jgi:hypothetical protein